MKGKGQKKGRKRKIDSEPGFQVWVEQREYLLLEGVSVRHDVLSWRKLGKHCTE